MLWHNMIAYPGGLKTEGDTTHLMGLSRQVQLYYVILMELCVTPKKLISSLLFIEGHPMSIFVTKIGSEKVNAIFLR